MQALIVDGYNIIHAWPALHATLRERDLVEKPVGAALVGDVFRAVGEEYVPVDPVPVAVLGAAELELLSGIRSDSVRRRRDLQEMVRQADQKGFILHLSAINP